MLRSRSAIAVMVAVALAFTGGLVGAPRAFAAPFLNIYPGFYGTDYIRPTVIQIENCTDPAIYSGATYEFANAAGKVLESGAAQEDRLPDGTLQGRSINSTIGAGFYTVTVTCLLYNGTTETSVTAPFVVGLEYLKIKSGDPFKGGPVALWSVGQFDPGEQVRMELLDVTGIDPSSGEVGKVLKTWATTSKVGVHSEWNFTADMPVLDRDREYVLSADGLSSGKVVQRIIAVQKLPDPDLEVIAGMWGSDYVVPTIIRVRQCGNPDVYSGVTYQVTDAAGKVVTKGSVTAVPQDIAGEYLNETDLGLQPGVYTVKVTCENYGDKTIAAPTASESIVVSSEVLIRRSGNLEAGGPVALWSIGVLSPGEQVKLELIDISPSLTDTGKDFLVKSWATTAVVGANGEWTYTVDLPKADPKRAYALRATGLSSGETPWLIFGNYPFVGKLPPTGA